MTDLTLGITGYRLRARTDAAAVGVMLFGAEGGTPQRAKATQADLERMEQKYGLRQTVGEA